MKKKLIVFACFLLVSLSCLPQLPVRLNERSVVLNTSTGALKGKMVTPNQESGYPCGIDYTRFRPYGYGWELRRLAG